MWNKSKLSPIGETTLNVKNPKNDEIRSVTFIVVSNDLMCLLGSKTCQEMGFVFVNGKAFVSKIDIDHEMSDLGDLGEVKLNVDSTLPARILPCRRLPIALKSKVQKELHSLVKRGVLIPETEPTDWVSQMAVVQKTNGKLRICIDPQPLNKALKREYYKLPILEDILPSLKHAKIFSKLDVQEVFWHIRLDEESSKLTTMITPFGRYRWARLPFGLKVSSEIFQRKLNEALEGLRGVYCVADDIVVVGFGHEEHDAMRDHEQNLQSLQKRCQEKNIKLNEEKSVYRKKEIAFMGHRLTSSGVTVDENKVDSSKDGIGAVIMQEGRPIEYASRTLARNERNWAQIEKEVLSVVFGLERFDQYTFGRRVIVHNDHKPLSSILEKPLSQAPMRLQVLMMRLNRYDVEYQYKSGKSLLLADTLSRACPKEENRDTLEVRDATRNDEELQELLSVIKEGWPDRKDKIPEVLKPYFDFRDSMSYQDGIILKGTRILIPSKLRNSIKTKLHVAHLGYDSMMRRARDAIFWPGMSKEIKQMVNSCDICQQYKPRNQKESLMDVDDGGFIGNTRNGRTSKLRETNVNDEQTSYHPICDMPKLPRRSARLQEKMKGE
ncbi:uncharacterized protein K02A2.6-like [Macrobrachium nipponense]|uniref:uncharacterized protein K02A2.6-like n=1 Tax=Macrobrachium nipponense TaxID=159736 RepID=UPI0030C81B17